MAMRTSTPHALLCNHLGRTYLQLGQYEQALVHNQESLALMSALGDHLEASYIQDDLAAIYLKLGQTDEAKCCLLESLAVKRDAGRHQGGGGGLLAVRASLSPQGTVRACA